MTAGARLEGRPLIHQDLTAMFSRYRVGDRRRIVDVMEGAFGVKFQAFVASSSVTGRAGVATGECAGRGRGSYTIDGYLLRSGHSS